MRGGNPVSVVCVSQTTLYKAVCETQTTEGNNS